MLVHLHSKSPIPWANISWCEGCSRNYPGGWAAGTFLSCGRGGHFVDMSKGVGGGNFSWGSRHIWSIVGRGCPEGRGADSMCVLGVEGSEKKCSPPPLRITSGTALLDGYYCSKLHCFIVLGARRENWDAYFCWCFICPWKFPIPTIGRHVYCLNLPLASTDSRRVL